MMPTIQLPLFPREADLLVCAFGTPWLDHFEPPIGTGRGCVACRDYRS